MAPETEQEGPLTREDSGGVDEPDAQEMESAVSLQALPWCKIPFPESTITPGRKWNPPHHYGVDFAQPGGTTVRSVAAGTVARVAESDCLGRYVVVKHSHDGKFSGYSHLSSRTVKAGDKVKKAEKIGEVGSTGTCSTGAHLHLTMSTTAEGFMQGNTMDPLKYIHGCD